MKDVLKTTVKTIVRLSGVHHHYQAWRSSAALPPFLLRGTGISERTAALKIAPWLLNLFPPQSTSTLIPGCGVVFWLFPGLKLGPLTAPSHFGLHVFAQVTTPALWCCCGLLLIWATRWLTVTFGCDHHVERILITPSTLPTPLSALIMAHNLMNSLDFNRLTHWRLPISAVLWAKANTNGLC